MWKPFARKSADVPRVIRIQISSAEYASPEDMSKAIQIRLEKLSTFSVFCPLSLSHGIALFDGGHESEVTITLHEGTTQLALGLWKLLRAELSGGIPGVDCGRIYDRGESWCAKTYDNRKRKADGFSEKWQCGFSPVRDC